MAVEISKNTDPDTYEILIRKRGDNDYASYCPQLNFMIKGTVHEEVQNQMQEHIQKHIAEITANTAEAQD